MRFVNQDRFVFDHGTGTCFNACVATVLDLPLSECMDILPTGEGVWFRNWQKWFKEKGWCLDFTTPDRPPPGYTIVSVYTERVYPEGHKDAGKSISHACVALEGEIVFDPYPGYTGAYSIGLYYVIKPWSETCDND